MALYQSTNSNTGQEWKPHWSTMGNKTTSSTMSLRCMLMPSSRASYQQQRDRSRMLHGGSCMEYTTYFPQVRTMPRPPPPVHPRHNQGKTGHILTEFESVTAKWDTPSWHSRRVAGYSACATGLHRSDYQIFTSIEMESSLVGSHNQQTNQPINQQTNQQTSKQTKQRTNNKNQ